MGLVVESAVDDRREDLGAMELVSGVFNQISTNQEDSRPMAA